MGSRGLSFEHPLIMEDMEFIAEELRKNGIWEKLSGAAFFVTGAAGMLASYFVYFLIYMNEYHQAGLRIFAQGRHLEKIRARFGEYVNKPYFVYVDADICCPFDADYKVDYIIHAASLASPQHYGKIPVEVAEPNALGTYYLLEFAREKAVKGFLYFSSGEVYGKVIETGDIREDTVGMVNPLDLHGCYGESKRMGETWCYLFAHEYEVAAKIARIAHTYGPTMDLENDPRVFSSFMRSIIEGGDIVLRSDGSAKRPFCYIADAVVAFFLILIYGKPGQAYNLANRDAFVSVLELANIMIKLSDAPLAAVKTAHSHNKEIVENRDNIDNNLNIDKLRELGWRPHFDIASGMKRVKMIITDKSAGV